MVADAFGADSGVGQNLRGVEDYIASLYSAQSKKDSKEIARIMKEAEDKGVLDQVVAGAKAFSVAPVDMLANALGTSAPAIATGLVATLASAPALVGLGISALTGAVMGAGTVKGAIYEGTKQAGKDIINKIAKYGQDSIATPKEYKKGGKVKKGGIAKVHKGEKILSKKQAAKPAIKKVLAKKPMMKKK